jgi:hypothetical protein
MNDRPESAAELPDLHSLLDQVSFSLDDTFLTERQTQVLMLRERGLTQSEIAERFGTTRANVTNIESSANANVDAASKTVELVDMLSSPVRVEIPRGTDVFDVPQRVYSACDSADVKADCSAVELVERLRKEQAEVLQGNAVRQPIRIVVSHTGDVRIYSTVGDDVDE